MSFFDRVKDGVEKLKQGSIPVPVSAKMINEIIQKTDKVENTSVEITKGLIVISGKAIIDKLMIKKKLPFTITLEPVKMEDRMIIFRIKGIKPVNFHFLNKKIFNKAPIFNYENNYIKMNFDGWDIIRKIPIGKIKEYRLDNGVIIVTIGL